MGASRRWDEPTRRRAPDLSPGVCQLPLRPGRFDCPRSAERGVRSGSPPPVDTASNVRGRHRLAATAAAAAGVGVAFARRVARSPCGSHPDRRRDCPGLNAVIRAVTRSLDRGHEVVGVRPGWRGLVEGCSSRSTRARSRGSCPAAARSSARRARTRSRSRAASTACSRRSPRAARRRRRDRRRGHARRRGAAVRRARVPGRRRAEDDRQRPLGDRLHVRLRHGGDRSRPRRSTACTRRPSRTTGSWWSR